MIGPNGQYAVETYRGGAFGDGEPNIVIGTSDLNAATVFLQADKKRKPYKNAISEGYMLVPAYLTRVVTIGKLLV